MPSYRKFLDALGERESDGDYGAESDFGHLGKYQFSEPNLIGLGYYTDDGDRAANDWKTEFWTGKDGIDSKADFLANGEVQEHAIRAHFKLRWSDLGAAQRYVDQVIGGLKITESGLLAGVHLRGVTRVTEFLDGGGVNPPEDVFGTPVTEYIKLFAGYRTPFTADHSGGETIAGGPKGDILRGFGGADTLRGLAGDDRLKGGAGRDLLDGGEGGDRLIGGRGGDVFRFADTPDPGAPDVLREFRSGRDAIELDHGVFAALPVGQLAAGMFSSDKARDADDHIILDRTTGALRYDPDGSGAEEAVVVAIIMGRDRPTHDDIVVG